MRYCSIPGCPKLTAMPCPLCQPALYTYPPAPTLLPVGCICPPTSEQTCQNPMCGRKAPQVSAAGYTPKAGESKGE